MFKFLNNPSNLSRNSNAEIRASSSPSVHKSFLRDGKRGRSDLQLRGQLKRIEWKNICSERKWEY